MGCKARSSDERMPRSQQGELLKIDQNAFYNFFDGFISKKGRAWEQQIPRVHVHVGKMQDNCAHTPPTQGSPDIDLRLWYSSRFSVKFRRVVAMEKMALQTRS